VLERQYFDAVLAVDAVGDDVGEGGEESHGLWDFVSFDCLAYQ
jgi:hypothetical protein